MKVLKIFKARRRQYRRGQDDETKVRSASTSPKAPISPGGQLRNSKPSLMPSTPGPGKLSAGRHPLKPSTSTYSWPNKPVLHPPVESGQYLSLAFTEKLALDGIAPSIGSVGDAYDNALMETINGLYKAQCIRTTVFHDGPYRTMADVDFANAGWVDWYKTLGLHSSLGYVPPAEYEQAHYAALNREPQPAQERQKTWGASATAELNLADADWPIMLEVINQSGGLAGGWGAPECRRAR